MGYRYGYNSQEKDTEVGSEIYTAQFWEYDGRLGRRWNVDPLLSKYPSSSPFSVNNNSPILCIDEDGLEGENSNCGPWGAAAGGIVEFGIQFMDLYFIEGESAEDAFFNVDRGVVLREAFKGLFCFGSYAKAASMLSNSKYQSTIYYVAKLSLEAAAEAIGSNNPYDVVTGVLGKNVAEQIKLAQGVGKQLAKKQSAYKKTINNAVEAQKKVAAYTSKLRESDLSDKQRAVFNKQLDKYAKKADRLRVKAEDRAIKTYEKYVGGPLSVELIDHVKERVTSKILKDSRKVIAGPIQD
jgi:hypothetical protein